MKQDGKSSGLDVVAYHVHDPNMSFVHADIVQFSKHCNRVLLFTTIEPSARLRALPNVEVVWPAMDWKRYRPVWLFIAHAPALLPHVLFARKFDRTVDADIFRLLDERASA